MFFLQQSGKEHRISLNYRERGRYTSDGTPRKLSVFWCATLEKHTCNQHVRRPTRVTHDPTQASFHKSIILRHINIQISVIDKPEDPLDQNSRHLSNRQTDGSEQLIPWNSCTIVPTETAKKLCNKQIQKVWIKLFL